MNANERSPSAYLMKSPPRQMPDDDASEAVEEFIKEVRALREGGGPGDRLGPRDEHVRRAAGPAQEPGPAVSPA